ncbi:hypothetical protein [Undibacterium sp. TC9W]|uniref:hypothetical protein n=1 Tax=Undibacterium sp. TC9W TaxID=3413053 RepID=UPI003BF2E1D9
MASSWDGPGPKRKLEDMHRYSCYLYGLVTIFFALGIFATGGQSIPHIALFILTATLSFAHFKLSAAVEQDKTWSRSASMALAFPLLLGFPIGTYMGVTILINAVRYEP